MILLEVNKCVLEARQGWGGEAMGSDREMGNIGVEGSDSNTCGPVGHVLRVLGASSHRAV